MIDAPPRVAMPTSPSSRAAMVAIERTGRTDFKSLRAFARWYLEAPAWPIAMPPNALRLHAAGSELVLYRSRPYQVELIIIRPGFYIPPHKHPNVDALDVNLDGYNRVVIARRVMPEPAASASAFARRVPVPRNVLHDGRTTTGSAYLSLQRWHREEIGFITDDWDGPLERAVPSARP
ncbi:MAG: hypothetical protein ACREFI_08810 [Stellaceae bacterium]